MKCYGERPLSTYQMYVRVIMCDEFIVNMFDSTVPIPHNQPVIVNPHDMYNQHMGCISRVLDRHACCGQVKKLPKVPIAIVQGKGDDVCPPVYAQTLETLLRENGYDVDAVYVPINIYLTD